MTLIYGEGTGGNWPEVSDFQREPSEHYIYEIAKKNGLNFKENSPYREEVGTRDTAHWQGKGKDS